MLGSSGVYRDGRLVTADSEAEDERDLERLPKGRMWDEIEALEPGETALIPYDGRMKEALRFRVSRHLREMEQTEGSYEIVVEAHGLRVRRVS